MVAILPIFCFLLAFLFLLRYYRIEWRKAFLWSSVLWGTLVVIFTEVLSVFKLLSFFPLTIAWGLVCLSLMGIIFYNRLWGTFEINWRINLPWFETGLLVYIFILAVVIGIIAWVSPPNTWDSMTYHMSRVVHWIQNKSVAFYPTHIIRQLYLSPWAEYAILHLQILPGGDQFANFIQWFSMIGSLVGVSLLAGELNADIRGQIISAVVCATIPMGILQASSTQNDYVLAFWLVCLIYFSMLFRMCPNLLHAIGVGLALGLAILTKATAYIYAFPFLVWLGLSLLRLRKVRPWVFISMAVMIAFTINIGHYTRNYNLFGSPLGVNGERPFIITNETFNISGVISNMVRNAGLQVGTPFAWLNAIADRGIYSFHKIIGISPNDARTTWFGSEFHVGYLRLHEDLSGDLLHFSLILVVPFLCVFVACERRLIIYIASVFAAFLLFSLYLKWQPWHSRLHLPLFVLSSPFVGLVLSRIKKCFPVNMIVVILMVVALPWVFFNASRPLIGSESALTKLPSVEKTFINPWRNKSIFVTSRVEKYFNNRPSLTIPYQEAAQRISELGCSNIGLIIGGDDWEYPIWALLHERMENDVYFTHVNVSNISKKAHDSTSYSAKSDICAVLAVGGEMSATLSVEERNYSMIWDYDLGTSYMGIYIERNGND